MKDYRVKVTIRNDRLLTAMEDLGYKSVMKFAEMNQLDYIRTAEIFRGKLKPVNEKGNLIPLAEEILRLGKAPAVLKKFQENVDYTEYKYKGKSAYYRLNDLLATTKIDGLTLEQKLTELIQSDEYLMMSDPLKINKTISDDGEKYTKIEEFYSKYLRDAKKQFNKEKGLFKHVDDDKRNLSEDIKILASNEGAVKSKTRTNQSLLRKLKGVINF